MPTKTRPIPSPSPTPTPETPRVRLVGFADDLADAIAERLHGEGSAPRVTVERGNDPPSPAHGSTVVRCLGPELSAREGRELLARAEEPEIFRDLVLGVGEDRRLFYDLVAADRLFFLGRETPDPGQVAALIRGALNHAAVFGPLDAPRSLSTFLGEGDENDGPDSPEMLALGEVLGHQSSAELLERAVDVIARLSSADRADCVLYDPASETLRSFRDPVHEQDSLAAGTLSFALRAAEPVLFDRVGESPFYDPDLDGFREDPDEPMDHEARLLVVPILVDPAPETGVDGGPIAVAAWVAWRAGRREPFEESDVAKVRRAGEPVVPVLVSLLHREDRQRHFRQRLAGAEAPGTGGLAFREEALEHYHEGRPEHGDVLRIRPEWTRLAYPLLLALFVSTLLFSLFGRVHEYAEGVGVVRLEGRLDVTAPVGGTVSEVLVDPGESVDQGRLLVKLYDVQEEAELKRIQREFELGLLDRLRRPADPLAARTLGALRAQRQQAESRLEERSVRAPVAGAVSDLRIQPGRLLAPGEVILSLHRLDENRRLLGVLPGRYRPQIRVGMPLRFELEGFRYAYQHLVVDAVSDEVFGPAEARRFLGPGIGDAVPLSGPVVLIEARLPTGSFESQGRAYEYHDGSLGNLELRVRSERILLTLIPGLKVLFADSTPESGGHP